MRRRRRGKILAVGFSQAREKIRDVFCCRFRGCRGLAPRSHDPRAHWLVQYNQTVNKPDGIWLSKCACVFFRCEVKKVNWSEKSFGEPEDSCIHE